MDPELSTALDGQADQAHVTYSWWIVMHRRSARCSALSTHYIFNTALDVEASQAFLHRALLRAPVAENPNHLHHTVERQAVLIGIDLQIGLQSTKPSADANSAGRGCTHATQKWGADSSCNGKIGMLLRQLRAAKSVGSADM